MKISDIITFVKAGYSPAEIAAVENPADVTALLQEGIKKEDIPNYLQLMAEKPEPDPEPAKDVRPAKEAEEDPVDYKSMYETLLKEKQQANIRKNMAADVPSDEETIEEIVRSFM